MTNSSPPLSSTGAARRPTITDVAALAGTSKGTVSFVLNGRPGVAAETRDRVLAAMAELGWQPSQPARSLSTSRANAIGLVLARTPETLRSDSFFAPFIAGVEVGLVHTENAVLLKFVEDTEAEETAYRTLATGRRVDGVIVTDLRRQDWRIRLLQELGLPAVTLNRPDVDSPFVAVCDDDFAGVRASVDHLTDLGHERIAHVSGPQVYLHAVRRRAAWQTAMRDHGLDPGAVVEGDFTAAGGADATARLLDVPASQRPTAIVYANDTMAVAGTVVAQSMGLELPRDLSVIGFDDSELAAHLNPPLTTVRTDPFAWGRLTARTLIDLVQHDSRPDEVRVGPAELVVRGSTTAPTSRTAGTRPHSR